jgi:hypothetical protein
MFVGDNGAAFGVFVAADRQSFLALPPPYSGDSFAQIVGDFFPGIEAVRLGRHGPEHSVHI